jgi:hypothetical protein
MTAKVLECLVQLGLQFLLSAALRFQELHEGGKDLGAPATTGRLFERDRARVGQTRIFFLNKIGAGPVSGKRVRGFASNIFA